MPKPERACPDCGAPAVDHGGIAQCTANAAHFDVYDLAALRGPIQLQRRARSFEPRQRPDGLTQGELDAIGWARESSAAQRDKGRGLADAMRQDFPWLDDADLARFALYAGTVISRIHKGATSWPALGPAEIAEVLKAAAVELAALEMTDAP
jgi:hypothetical protein